MTIYDINDMNQTNSLDGSPLSVLFFLNSSCSICNDYEVTIDQAIKDFPCNDYEKYHYPYECNAECTNCTLEQCADKEPFRKYGIYQWPTSIAIDCHSDKIDTKVGAMNKETLEQWISAMHEKAVEKCPSNGNN